MTAFVETQCSASVFLGCLSGLDIMNYVGTGGKNVKEKWFYRLFFFPKRINELFQDVRNHCG